MVCLAQNGRTNGHASVPRVSAKPWERNLRQLLKASHGAGWLLRPGRGDRTQVIRCWDDGTRSSVMVPIPWEARQGPALLALIERLASLMAKQEVPLAEAAALLETKSGVSPAELRAGALDWHAAADRFRDHLLSTGTMTERTYRKNAGTYVRRALEVMSNPKAPKDGRAALEAVIRAHELAPGCEGRKRMVDGVSRFLAFAVDRCGASDRYLPPTDRSNLIGFRVDRPSISTPVLDDQFLRLLAAISDPRWHLAVGLAGVFGLRPVELGNCRPEGGALRVKGVKRNHVGRSADRLVQPLDPKGASGLGADLLSAFERRGPEGLPPKQRDWAAALFHHLTKRVPIWKDLLTEAETADQGHLTPYGLRHGYAWRGSQLYSLSPRVLAALMGHTVAVHLQHYGQWASEAETAAAVAKAVERVQLGS